MKVGIFTDSYSPLTNGVTISTQSTVDAIRKLGHDVYVIAPSHPRHKDTEQKIYRLASVEFFTPDARWAMQLPQKSLLEAVRIDFDVIHGHSGGPISLLGWELAQVKGIPFVYTYHTLWSKYTHYVMQGKLISPRMVEASSKITGNLCDFIIAPTERVKKELVSYGIHRDIKVLPTGIDLASYAKVPKGYIREKLGIAKNAKILLSVSRLGKEKSVDFLLHSFVRIHAKHPNTVLVLAGSGPERRSLRKLAKDLGIQDSVYFLGVIRHTVIPKVYADADIFVFASQTETQGMVILEAIATGLPVVVVQDAAYKGFVLNNKNGFSVRKNYDSFAAAVDKLLTDKNLYTAFSKHAKETASKYSIDATAKYLEQVYNRLIKQHEGKGRKRKVIIQSIEEFSSLVKKTTNQVKDFRMKLKLP